MSATFSIKLNRLGDLQRLLLEGAEKHVCATAEHVEAAAKDTVRVRSGAARAGIYRVTADHDGYAEAVAEGVGDNHAAIPVPEVDKPVRKTQAFVAGAFAHNLLLELGTHNTSAHPYLTPAAEAERERFVADFAKVLDA